MKRPKRLIKLFFHHLYHSTKFYTVFALILQFCKKIINKYSKICIFFFLQFQITKDVNSMKYCCIQIDLRCLVECN